MGIRVATLFVASLISWVSLWGQATTTSSVIGQVTDSTNAAIPGADVTLTDLGTKIAKTASTNQDGRYIFPNIDPGTYSVVVTKQGFAKSQVASQYVEVSSTATLNFKLELGTSTTTIEVKAVSGAELQTTNAAVGNTINGASLDSLPNFGRDVTTLSVIQPGVTLSGNAAGAVSDQNTYTLDGGNNSDDMSGQVTTYVQNFTGLGGTQQNGTASGVMPTPVESIEEIKVNSFNQTADFTASIGSQVVMATKRGTNQFHGAGYGYYFDTALGAANSWTNDHTPDVGLNLPFTPIVSNHRIRYGFSIGGPITTKKFLGGKTYFFFNLENLRFPNAGTYEHETPTAALRAGVVQIPNASGAYVPYNLNPYSVTVPVGTGLNPAMQTLAPAVCATGNCDPRGLGLNPVVNTIWNKYMPAVNDPIYSGGDNYNVEGYLSTIRAPLNSNNYVGRIDHDFNDKWRWYTSYRDQRLISLTTNQVDIGGALPGDKFGVPSPYAPRTQIPDYFVTGLTTNITPTVTNTFLFNYIRNFWQWSSDSSAQVPGTGLTGALEIGGETANGLIPFNVNTQSVRQRFWDGQDKIFKDDITIIKGNHLIQVGGSYQRNFDYHTRTDNGGGINNAIVYLSGSTTNANINWTNSPYIPSTIPSGQYSTYESYYDEALGIVTQPQVAYTRSGTNLAIQPLGSTAFDKSIIPTYAEYFSDTWHVKPTFTLIYGLGYTIEMPPYEQLGKQIVATDDSGQPLIAQQYLAEKSSQALQGQAYNPYIGFTGVRTIGSGEKYPYNPVYNEFSPRVAFAWQPNYDSGILGKVVGHGKTVLRGGYGRIYGRLNGVALVLTPLLGVGLIQAVTCAGPTITGACGGATPANAWRAGTDGGTAPLSAPAATLPQPFYPGVAGNSTAGDAETLDPTYRPQTTDNFTLTVQREVTRSMTVEVGYIGRKIRNENQMLDIDAVPTMFTLNNQQFASAFANMYLGLCGNGPVCANNSASSIAAQPFIESALGGASSAYCSGYASCTQAVLANDKSLITGDQVSDLWLAMSKAPSWTIGRSTASAPLTTGGASSLGQFTGEGLLASHGFGSYNALFITYSMKEFHGVSLRSNFTWSRALGTAAISQASSDYTALNPYNLQSNYGPQGFDVPKIFNVAAYYRPTFYPTQKGIIGHIVGGWTISPLFTAQSGSIDGVGASEGSCTCQAFGEVADSASSFGPETEEAVFASKFTGGNSANYNNVGQVVTINGTATSVGTNSANGINMFSNPGTVFQEFRRCIVGYDTNCGGYGNIRGLPTWNLDAQALKDIGVWKEGKVGATLSLQVTNTLNHMQPGNPTLSLTSPTTFGRITSQANTPRNLEIGIRVHF